MANKEIIGGDDLEFLNDSGVCVSELVLSVFCDGARGDPAGNVGLKWIREGFGVIGTDTN